MDISFLVNKYSEKITDDKIFFSPDIPNKKLRNAINAYAQEINEDDALLLVDNTAFGGAKAGMLISSQKIYMTNNFIDENQSLELNKLKTVTGDFDSWTSNNIDFNEGILHLELIMPNEKGIRTLVQMLQDLCGLNRTNLNNKEVDERPIKTPWSCHSCGATNQSHLSACEYCESPPLI